MPTGPTAPPTRDRRFCSLMLCVDSSQGVPSTQGLPTAARPAPSLSFPSKHAPGIHRLLTQTNASIRIQKHSHTQRKHYTQTHTNLHTQTQCTVSAGTAQAPSWRASWPVWGAALGHRAGALTCHGCGLPAGEAALSRAQPPLLTGAVQFWAWCEGTFHFSILEESQRSQASEGSSPTLGHLRAKEGAGGQPSPS